MGLRSGGLREDHPDSRTIVVRGVQLGIRRRQLEPDLVSVRGSATMMVVAVGIAAVDVQQCRFGIETEERYAQNDGDRPHLEQVYLKTRGRSIDCGHLGVGRKAREPDRVSACADWCSCCC